MGRTGRQFSAKVKDLTEVLAADIPALRIPNSALRTTYHDACHLAHPQHITKQPRQLVRALVGGNFVELPESDVCCGSAGSYNLTEPEMAERLQKRKIENILKTGAKTVVTTNPGCLLQIRAGLKKAGADDVEALHIADFLDRAAR
jgi:glycolate oxidase iron-sulfur subunit